MEALDKILEGFEAALELERSLGVRSLQFDRSLLEPLPGSGDLESNAAVLETSALSLSEPSKPPAVESQPRIVEPRSRTIEPPPPAAAPQVLRDFVFLHHRALSPKGNEMMAKIIVAMNRTAEEAPVVIHAPAPPAKAYVVLGSLALKMFFPNEQATPGSWISVPGGVPALVTYSPEYILRFQEGAIAQREVKKKMWDSLKGVIARFPR